MSFSPAIHNCGGETDKRPVLPSVTLTYERLGHKDEISSSTVCRSLLEVEAFGLDRTSMRMTKDFSIFVRVFPAASEIVRVTEGRF
jgi:hypothetical protein